MCQWLLMCVQTYSRGPGAGFRFRCQHGPAECQGNTFHACAAAHSEDEAARLEAVMCMMVDNYDPARAAAR